MKIDKFDLSYMLGDGELDDLRDYLLTLDNLELYTIVLYVIDNHTNNGNYTVVSENLTTAFKNDNYLDICEKACAYGNSLLDVSGEIESDLISKKLSVYTDSELVDIKSTMSNINGILPMDVLRGFVPTDINTCFIDNSLINEYLKKMDDVKWELNKLNQLIKK